MNDYRNLIPDRTLEAFARGFFNEASLYGFKQTDYVRFVNHLLDITIAMKNGKDRQPPGPKILAHAASVIESLDIARASQLPIAGEQVSIRPFNLEDDLALLKHWLNDDVGMHFLLPFLEPEVLNYEEFLSNPQNCFGIITLNSGQSVGVIAYLNHDPTQRRAEFRKLIGDPGVRGQGFGKKAVPLWLAYGIAGLGLKKIILTTLDTNTRNIRLNESLGFKVEGILRNEVFLDGRYHDVLRMGLWVDEHSHSNQG
jgi:RimJ/RimL family protein N-acetyltransferase